MASKALLRSILVSGEHREDMFVRPKQADEAVPSPLEGMEEPDRQGTGIDYDPLNFGRMLAQNTGNNGRIGSALAAPNSLAVSADTDRSVFQGQIEIDILTHGCSPRDTWARRPVVSPQLHPAGEQLSLLS